MAMSIGLSIAYSCFCVTMAGLSCCSRDYMTYKRKYIYFLALYRKSLLIFAPRSQQNNKLNPD